MRGITAAEYEVLRLHFTRPDRDATPDELRTAGELAVQHRSLLHDEPDGIRSKITRGHCGDAVYEAMMAAE
jgi:hypothetical protein